jgi:hypothetical protein
MAPRNIWTADRRLYLDKAGAVVEADDPTRATLLVPAGGALPYERAQALGLIVEPAPAEEAPPPASKPQPKNKVKAPAETKAPAPDSDTTPPPAED